MPQHHDRDGRPSALGTIAAPCGPAEDAPVRRGRPQDEALTRRLLENTLDLLAAHGFSRLTSDGLAARTGAGKAGIYRRWADLGDVVAAAVDVCEIVPSPPNTGSLRHDLIELLQPLTTPLGRDELAAAALLSQARHDPRIQRALDDAVVTPLADAVAVVMDQHAHRGHTVSSAAHRLVPSMVQALWWDRYLTLEPATRPEEVVHVVDRILLPLLG